MTPSYDYANCHVILAKIRLTITKPTWYSTTMCLSNRERVWLKQDEHPAQVYFAADHKGSNNKTIRRKSEREREKMTENKKQGAS